MFGRQWFPPDSQVGISNVGLDFEEQLRLKDYDTALKLCIDNINNNKNYWKRQYKRLMHLQSYYFANKQNISKNIAIYFNGFWPDFDESENQILDFLNASSYELNVSYHSSKDIQSSDILLESCYGSPLSVKYEHLTKILFLGENVRPFYSHYDYSMSFDRSTYGSRNIYLPLWFLEIDHFGKHYQDRKPYPIEMFLNNQVIDYDFRKEEVVFVGNNSEPFREYILSILPSHNIKVERYGSHTRPVNDKMELLKNYKMSLCFENSFYPGYITEKLIHALLSGTKSVYWGGLVDEEFVNHPNLILLHSEMDESQIISRISRDISVTGKVEVPALLTQKQYKKRLSSTLDLLKNITYLFS